MTEDSNGGNDNVNRKVTVEAESIEGIMDVLDLELIDDTTPETEQDTPAGLESVLDTLADIYRGVMVATEHDSRGRSRKMVREYAEREDLTSDAVGHILRVLEEHDLVVQDGNRWRLADGETA